MKKHFEIYKQQGKDQRQMWRWRLFHKDQNVGRCEEPFKTKQTITNSLRNLLQFFNYDSLHGSKRLVFYIFKSANDEKWYWRLQTKYHSKTMAIAGQGFETEDICRKQTSLFTHACEGAVIVLGTK